MLNENNDHGLFEVLEPPPGGLTRLRGRIRRVDRRRARTWQWVGATAVLAVIAVSVLLLPALDRDRGQRLDLGSELMAIRFGLVEPPAEPVTIAREDRHQFAARRVPTTDENVVFYLVGSTQHESRD